MSKVIPATATISTDALKAGIGRLLHATFPTPRKGQEGCGRPAMESILFEITEGHLRMVVTDAHRGIIHRPAATVKGEGVALLSTATCKVLVKALPRKNADVTLVLGEECLQVSFGMFGEGSCYPMVKAQFPNYRRVYPDHPVYHIMPVADVLKVLEPHKKVGRGGNTEERIVLEWTAGTLKVTLHNTNAEWIVGTGYVMPEPQVLGTFETGVEGASDFTIAFCPYYLYDMLSCVQVDKAEVRHADPREDDGKYNHAHYKPVRIIANEVDYVLMPMLLPDERCN